MFLKVEQMRELYEKQLSYGMRKSSKQALLTASFTILRSALGHLASKYAESVAQLKESKLHTDRLVQQHQQQKRDLEAATQQHQQQQQQQQQQLNNNNKLSVQNVHHDAAECEQARLKMSREVDMLRGERSAMEHVVQTLRAECETLKASLVEEFKVNDELKLLQTRRKHRLI